MTIQGDDDRACCSCVIFPPYSAFEIVPDYATFFSSNIKVGKFS